MSCKVKNWFSAGELARMGSAGVKELPTSDPGCKWRAQERGWESRQVKSRGGKKGMRTEYMPTGEELQAIQTFLHANPDFFDTEKTGELRQFVSEPRATYRPETSAAPPMRTISAYALAALRLPGKPTTAKGWYQLVAREGWPEIKAVGSGRGRKGGIRREFVPPDDIQALIDQAKQAPSLQPLADRTRLQDAIETVEAGLSAARATMTAAQKTELILAVYDLLEDPGISRAKVRKLINLTVCS